MKNFFISFLVVFTASFFIGCGTEKGKTSKKCTPECKSWETCKDGKCVLQENKCDDNKDCKENQFCDKKNHQCNDKNTVCTAGSKRCNENNVEQCNFNGSEWKVKFFCTNSQMTCDEESLTCKCTEDEKRCSNGNVQICKNGDWVIEKTCRDGQTCDKDTNRCKYPEPVCNKNGKTDEKRCNGRNVETCSADGREWEVTTTCKDNEACDEDSISCMPILCKADQKKCDENKNAVNICNESKTGWKLDLKCKDSEYCNKRSNMCKDKSLICNRGEKKCNGSKILKCSDDEKSWKVEDTCLGGSVCDVDTFKCGTISCTPNERKCQEVKQKGMPSKKIVVCNASGTAWNLEKTCEGENVCDGRSLTCEKEVCKPESKRCDEQKIFHCNEWGTEEKLAETCTGTDKCVDGFSLFECKTCRKLSFDKLIRNPEPDRQGIYSIMNQSENMSLSLQFYQQSPVGSYTLGWGINNNFKYCKQCVLVFKHDQNKPEFVTKKFFAESGTLKVLDGDPKIDKDSSGQILNAILVEVTTDPKTKWSTPVKGGECIEIAEGNTWHWGELCKEGDVRCSKDKTKLEVCNDKHEWKGTKCEDPRPVCVSLSGTPACRTCEPNTKQCDREENTTQVCEADGSKWKTVKDCDDENKVCNNSTFECVEKNKCVGLSLDTSKIERIEKTGGLSGRHFNYYQFFDNYEELIVFFDKRTPVGKYDLSKDKNSNYKTCEQCINIRRARPNQKVEWFFQSEGELEVLGGEPRNSLESSFKIANVKLVEVTLSGLWESKPVENGECFDIQTEVVWNSMPPCTVGEKRCSNDKKSIETCENGNIWTQQTCETSSPICTDVKNAPTCVICIPNSHRCNSKGNVETCSDDGTSWTETAVCEAGKTTCNERSGQCLAKNECMGLSFEPAKQIKGFSSLYYTVNPANNMELQFQFYNSSPAGEYDLSKDKNKNLGTCEQCVVLFQLNNNNKKKIEKKFFQKSGKLKVISGDPRIGGANSGEVTNVKLVEITEDKKHNSTEVPNGECIEIQTATWENK